MSLLGGAENPLEVDFSASLETPKSVMKFIARTLPIAALALSLLFCEEEDKKLKAQLDKQALEIQAKEAELKMVRHDVAANRIDDPTEELAEITLKVDEAESVAAEAADEVEQPKGEKLKLEHAKAATARRNDAHSSDRSGPDGLETWSARAQRMERNANRYLLQAQSLIAVIKAHECGYDAPHIGN